MNDSLLAFIIGLLLATGRCGTFNVYAGGLEMDAACAKVCPSGIGEVHDGVCMCGSDGGWVPLTDFIATIGDCS